MENMTRRLAAMPDKGAAAQLRFILKDVYDRLSCQSLASAGLVIKAGASALVKTGATAWHGTVKGKLLTIAAATDMPALSGSVANATFNVFVFSTDAAGTRYADMGTAAAARANVKWPKIVPDRAIIGFVIINPTGTGSFVGGTTALDDATVVPNAQYVSPIGAFDPTANY